MNFEPLAKNQDLAGGQIGDGFLRINYHDGWLNDFFGAVGDTESSIICPLLGPGFLRVLFTKKRCTNAMPTLTSYASYCSFLRQQPPSIQQCFSDAALDLESDLNGIVKLDFMMWLCCENCNNGSKFSKRKRHIRFYNSD